jgi:hypothetical protein
LALQFDVGAAFAVEQGVEIGRKRRVVDRNPRNGAARRARISFAASRPGIASK